MIRLVLHSNDQKLQSLLAVTLGEDYNVLVEPNKDRVRRILADEQADVLILDYDSGRAPLDELLSFLSEIAGSPIPVVVMTDDEKRSTAMKLVQHGVYDYFRKPPHLLELKLVVRRAHEHARLKRELHETREKLEDFSRCDQLIGSSGQMRVVYDLIRRVASLDANVLIRGESGTGKELVARATHNLGDRAKRPFVAVSCGAIPETLIETELFGHEKGAFTGAAGTRAGYFEQAGDGTLFLDEIGELSLQTQVKLLRVLQERQFCRVGGSKLIPLRARLLFATHQYLAQMVEERTFRQDLFFRVNVLKIQVPPLRERTEDIPVLAQHFLEQYSASYQNTVRRIHPGAMKLLTAYDWPGNVRELENVIQRAVILAEGDTIRPEALPDTLQPTAPFAAVAVAVNNSYQDQLKGYKVELAKRAVLECHGNKALAARKLNINRGYLYRLLREPMEEGELAAN